jgi:acyl-coenzyme A thioesterase PaaI-like protein
VRGIARVIHETRTTARAEGRIEDGEGKLYAFATTTCVIRRAERRP